ncbi:peptide IlvX [Enterobacter ludwigii]|uniref:Peptide IlvX n=3 Tax=Enterobacter cloacae complex TaxID=354276 RepID=A0A3R8ZCZ7_ENTCL|nr:MULTISPECIES: peptide IlvX [Enterobacter]MCL6722626.1 peptide IlvX [Klebsiella sp. T2.Ur]AVP03323.1 hypothetical protein AM379_07265 [Enterobacter cloacae complex sp. FDA-CDC-AR_0132]AWC87342.1 hypothetical protein AM410_07590 [Enterobacter cloacae complex sp. FDA-CDC-AR_0164]EGQ5296974.1 hypothetical protein [Enterobacter cloacae]EGQ7344953.1 hypothetical protein [Enterobacter cloacae]
MTNSTKFCFSRFMTGN